MSDITVKLCACLNRHDKIEVEKFVDTEVVKMYKNNEIYRTFSIGYLVIEHENQKFEVFLEELSSIITLLICFISIKQGKDIHSMLVSSETNHGSSIYIASSDSEKIVKIAYLDERIGMGGGRRGEVSRVNRLDYHTGLEWVSSFIDKEHIIYSRDFVWKNKKLRRTFEYHFEGEITLPYRVFFGSFFDQVENYWRILKGAGLASAPWEELEEAKKVVDAVRLIIAQT